MAFVKPSVKEVVADIKEVSIYLRSTKKFGKTTLFRDTILAKYGDPSRGLLVGCGNEFGYKMLDNLNSTQVSSWDDLVELKNWLIQEKGREHNIEIVAFDTGDELCLLADQKTIKISNRENPTKPVKSIRAAMGGYTAGEKYSANNLIKPFMTELQLAGFGVWVIAHTKFKSIKEKGGLEEDGYMQLTSNLSADYESAFGDIFDATITGVIDRAFDEKKENGKTKKYATDSVRKLYFRGTTLIDAGGRFATGAVPEYMEYTTDSMTFAKEFVKVVENGINASKIQLATSVPKSEPKSAPKVESKPEPEIEAIDPDEFEDLTEQDNEFDIDAYREEIRAKYKAADNDIKAEIRAILAEKCNKKLDNADKDVLDKINELF